MGHHETTMEPKPRIAGLRVKRSNSDAWEDYSHLVGIDPSSIGLPGGNEIMRVKCFFCSEVNSISAHVEYDQDVSWGCSACGELQVIVPATLEQRPFTDPPSPSPSPSALTAPDSDTEV